MTDGGKNVKNRTVAGTYTSTAVSQLVRITGLYPHFFPPFSTNVYCRAEKKKKKTQQGCERAWPLRTTSLNNRWQRKEVHKSINPWLLAWTHLKPLRWLPVTPASPSSPSTLESDQCVYQRGPFYIYTRWGFFSGHCFHISEHRSVEGKRGGKKKKDVLWSVVTQPWTRGPCEYRVNTVNQGHDLHQIFKAKKPPGMCPGNRMSK